MVIDITNITGMHRNDPTTYRLRCDDFQRIYGNAIHFLDVFRTENNRSRLSKGIQGKTRLIFALNTFSVSK